MSSLSSIEWTDRTWNPVRGCSIVSPGCHNCYAMKFAHRFSGEGKPYEGLTKQTKAGPQWTGMVRQVEEALLEPLHWRKPQRIFVNSMSDLFHEGVPDEFIDRVFAVMVTAGRHTFQILTKRADRMRDYMLSRVPTKDGHVLPPEWLYWLNEVFDDKGRNLTTRYGERRTWRGQWPVRNIWLGVSCEDQQRADERIPLLLQTPAAVRFISAEPLLGPVDLWPFMTCDLHRGPCMPGESCQGAGNIPCGRLLDWVIVGGESGAGARPCDLAWIRTIVQTCHGAMVPVFVKQVGPWLSVRADKPAAPGFTPWTSQFRMKDRKGGDPAEWPADVRVRQFPRAAAR